VGERLRISFILPVLNEAGIVAAQLQGLQVYRQQGHELLLVDGGSKDNTVEIARPLVDVIAVTGPSRSLQMNRGAELASGEILLFLHIDTSLPEAADQAIVAALAQDKLRWGWFDVRLSNPALIYRIIANSMNLRARLSSVCTGDQAMFVEKSLFIEAQGFPSIALMEDVAISKRLRRLARPATVGSKVEAASRRWQQKGVLNTIWLMWWLRLQYFLGVSPERLRRRYYGRVNGLQRQASGSVPRQTSNSTRILVFAREPVLGEVKTRLQVKLGAQRCLELYRQMMGRMIETIKAAGSAELDLWVTSNISHEYFVSLCNKKNIHLQVGNDLGQKMAHALAQTLAMPGVGSVLIVGTDCPAMSSSYLHTALSALEQQFDVVIGPAEDGGYVLLGMRTPMPELFTGIDWGTDRVLPQTLARLDGLALRYKLLDVLWDVDRPADLSRLLELEPPLLEAV